MSGPELVVGSAIAKAAATTGEHLLEEHKSISAALQDAAKDTPALQVAAETYAKRLALREEFLYRLFLPVARLVGVRAQYFEAQFAQDLAAKTAEIPDEQMVSPRPIVAAPAIEALGYSLDEPELKKYVFVSSRYRC